MYFYQVGASGNTQSKSGRTTITSLAFANLFPGRFDERLQHSSRFVGEDSAGGKHPRPDLVVSLLFPKSYGQNRLAGTVFGYT